MTEYLRTSRIRLLAAMMMLTAAGACVHATGSEGDDHSKPDGLIIRQGNNVLVEVNEQSITGSLTVQQGQQTAELTVVFVTHDGDELAPDPSEYYLNVAIDDEDVLEWVLDVAGAFSGRLRGNTVGQAALSFSLVHGQVGSGHPDYISPPVTGAVTP